MIAASAKTYHGRIAPSPTGLLHLGHARTFWIAWQRARQAGGQIILRNEDLDPQRSKVEFVQAFMEDLRWLGLGWDEGPDIGGPHAPYNQSERTHLYRDALQRLIASGHAYPCYCSRKEVQLSSRAPHAEDEEAIYAGTCRPALGMSNAKAEGRKPCWRFRVPDGEAVRFVDGHFGPKEYVAGRDFGDFVIWRPDDVPAYQLAVVVDDALMGVTEVVRGVDLLVSTARQILLFRALSWEPPAFFHCPLLTDEHGVRLAKRNDALSLRTLREQGREPRELISAWQREKLMG
ncbi:MAG: Glutamate--tRNA ligase [Verrucomicrobia bacterium]|nr:Glutamate--tRNA ligase [Verrucomicrobiota bacterium]